MPYGSTLLYEYFLYFLGGDGTLHARHDFTAESDAAATECATYLISACGDMCASGELWGGARLVTRVFANAAPDEIDRFSVARQEQIIDLEETILRSRSQLARSHQLVQSVEAARKRR